MVPRNIYGCTRYVYLGTHATFHMWMPDKSFVELVLSFYIYADSRDEVRLYSKPSYSGSYLGRPQDGPQVYTWSASVPCLLYMQSLKALCAVVHELPSSLQAITRDRTGFWKCLTCDGVWCCSANRIQIKSSCCHVNIGWDSLHTSISVAKCI